MTADLDFKQVRPPAPIARFVESFWALRNLSGRDKEIVVLPDGRIDLTFFRSERDPFQIIRSGIETLPQKAILKTGTTMFAISFRLLAVEHVFGDTISHLLNYAEYLPASFWDFGPPDLDDFDRFCRKASAKILSLLPPEADPRKQKLFDLIYASNGSQTVAHYSKEVSWRSRQINRYFNQKFGLSLKAYCSILRFRASFHHLKEGKLFPQQNFADQSHFIKEVRKLSGVSPKELQRNRDDRFIQFSALLPE